MTYRERREAKADRLRGWADKRQTDAVEQLNSQPEMRHDWAFITQPGRIPQRDRMNRADERAFRSMEKAERMTERAGNIDAQLRTSIYSDDPDAIEALGERIQKLEAEREAVKAHNKAMRKPGACDHPAGCDCRSLFPRDCSCKRHPLPGYVLQNLGGNITRQRQRLAQLQRQQEQRTAAVEAEHTGNGVTVRQTAARCEVEFPAKPDADVRTALKAHGFRWDRVASVWYVRTTPTDERAWNYALDFTR